MGWTLSLNTRYLVICDFCCNILLNNFSIDIACLSLYCVNATALSFKVLSLTFDDKFYRYFQNTYYILDIPRVCSMEFIHIPQLVLYHISNFCTLENIAIINFHSDGVCDALRVKILTTYCFHSIHYWKKEIRIILIIYIKLEY